MILGLLDMRVHPFTSFVIKAQVKIKKKLTRRDFNIRVFANQL